MKALVATAGICLLCWFGMASAQASIDYLVIAPGSWVAEFDSFAHWKTSKGIRTAVMPVESIVAHHAGRDDAERVRSFIQLWRDSLGVQWVLLAGEPPLVPARRAFAMGQNVLCDMYFADLDGNWDRNGNGIYGEPADSVEMCPDINVGRAPVSSAVQARGIAAKWLHYELGPTYCSRTRLLQCSDTTSLSPPPGWTTALLVPPIGRYQLRDSLQAGFDVVWHVGPGDREQLGDPYGTILDISDAGNLTNHDRLGVLLSSAPNAGDFSANCVLGALARNANGGCVATLGNSGMGYSACRPLYYEFFNCLFGSDSLRRVGQSQRRAKCRYAPDARSDQTWRLALYHWNLLGDPELAVMAETARALAVSHPVVLDTGAQNFPVSVRSGTVPCSGYVCLWKGDEVYERRWVTDSAEMPIHPRSIGEMLVTVTAPNHRPYRGSAGIAVALSEAAPLSAGAAPGPTVVSGVSRLRNPVIRPGESCVELRDAAGRRVMALRPGANDVSGLAPGVYFVRSAVPEGREADVGKVVIAR